MALVLGPLLGILLVVSVGLLRISLTAVTIFLRVWNYDVFTAFPRNYLYILNYDDFQGALNIAALLVHLWLPFFALCVGLLKGLNYFQLATKGAQWFLKQGRLHPLDALGFVAAPLVFLIAVAVQVLVGK
jgi:hypothetical protein